MYDLVFFLNHQHQPNNNNKNHNTLFLPPHQCNLLRQEMLQSLILFQVRMKIYRTHDFYMLFVSLAEQHEAQTLQSHQMNTNILSLLDEKEKFCFNIPEF